MSFYLLFFHSFSSRDSTRVHCVDLGESFPTSTQVFTVVLFTCKLWLIQPRTSLLKFALLVFREQPRERRWQFGTGLGLYHVRQLAHALDGEVRHVPNEPRGAVFQVDVPFVLVSDLSGATTRTESAGAAPAPASAPSSVPAGFGHHSVLVVDDEDFIKDVTTGFLEALGVGSVVLATDGADGLHKLTTAAEGPFTLTIMDLQMPTMDGFEAVRRLRAWEADQNKADGGDARPRQRVVAVSANADDPGVHEQCVEAGFDDVAPKPLLLPKLRRLLHDIGGGAAVPLPAHAPRPEPVHGPIVMSPPSPSQDSVERTNAPASGWGGR